MKINMATREIKPEKRQAMHDAVAHHPLTNAQTVPEQQLAPPAQTRLQLLG